VVGYSRGIENEEILKSSYTEKLVLIVLLLAGVAAFIVIYSGTPSWDFRNNLWGPAHLLLQGKSPYNLEVIFPDVAALWSPPTVGAFFLIGAIPLQQASNLWMAVNVLTLFAIFVLSQRASSAGLALLMSVLPLILLFPPVISTLLLGQISIVIVLFFLTAARFIETEKYGYAALLIIVSFAKPQLGVFALAGILYSIWREFGKKEFVRFVLRLIGFSVLLLAPLFVAQPDWIGDYFAALRQNPGWAQPTLLHLLRNNFETAGLVLWAVLFLVMLYLSMRTWGLLKAQPAMVRSMALTTIVAPYMWSYDFVLAVPFLVEIFFGLSSVSLRTKYFIVLLAISITMVWMNVAGFGDNSIFWWVPLAIGLLILWAAWTEKRDSGKNLLLPRA